LKGKTGKPRREQKGAKKVDPSAGRGKATAMTGKECVTAKLKKETSYNLNTNNGIKRDLNRGGGSERHRKRGEGKSCDRRAGGVDEGKKGAKGRTARAEVEQRKTTDAKQRKR